MTDIRTTPDEEKILRALVDGPKSVRDVLRTIAAIPPLGGTAAQFDAWTRSRAGYRTAEKRLLELGMVEGPASARRLTPAGHGEIARIDAAHGGGAW